MSKILTGILVAVLSSWFAAPGQAGERKAGPHKGRIVEAAGARFEFVLDKGRRAHVYTLDASGAPADPGKATVTLRANLKSGGKPVAVSTTTAGIDGTKETVKHFVSTAALPSPDEYELVLTVKSGKKTGNVRIQLVEHACGGCSLAEYACICDH